MVVMSDVTSRRGHREASTNEGSWKEEEPQKTPKGDLIATGPSTGVFVVWYSGMAGGGGGRWGKEREKERERKREREREREKES